MLQDIGVFVKIMHQPVVGLTERHFCNIGNQFCQTNFVAASVWCAKKDNPGGAAID
jgi:hypothetical protein